MKIDIPSSCGGKMYSISYKSAFSILKKDAKYAKNVNLKEILKISKNPSAVYGRIFIFLNNF